MIIYIFLIQLIILTHGNNYRRERPGSCDAGGFQVMVEVFPMDGSRGGSFTPSYKEVVANESKIPPDKGRGKVEEGRRNKEEETEGSKLEENDGTKDKEENDKKQRKKTKIRRDHVNPRLKSLLE